MRGTEFEKIISEQLDLCKHILNVKEEEYATDCDRLHNFKLAADLQGINIVQALGGMMVKHTASVYDLIRESDNSDFVNMGLWNEKITDHINYLLLLKAAVIEHNREDCCCCE